MGLSSIQSTAERLLSSRFGTDVDLRLRELQRTAKSVCFRAGVLGSGGDLPESVILKQDPQAGTPPPSPLTRGDLFGLLNDWAACEFLHPLPIDPPLAPLAYGGDIGQRLLVMEDLGAPTGPGTHDLLTGDDPEAAERGLLEHAALLGRLHGATIGRADEYDRIRAGLGPRPEPLALYTDPWSNARRRRSAPHELASALRRYRDACAAAGAAAADGVDDEIEAVTRRVEEDPGAFLTFCKGDQNFAGDFLRTPAGLRLFDYDAGGFRHALIEGMPARVTWGCTLRLPEPLLEPMEGSYRAALADHCPAAGDDTLFQEAMADAGARWHVFHVVWRLPDALKGDRPRGPSSLRQQMVAWIDAFIGLAGETRRYPALNRTARRLARRLRSLWGADAVRLPPYPAFR